MSRTIEFPEPLYTALEEAAAKSGISLLDWIAARLPKADLTKTMDAPAVDKPQTLADLFAGRVGRIHSGSSEPLSEGCGEELAGHLEAKRNLGHL